MWFLILGSKALKSFHTYLILYLYVLLLFPRDDRFSDLRNDWLAGGDVARSTQTSYTVRVERIPRAFRSPAILQKFFSTLFPGQVPFVLFLLLFFLCVLCAC